MKCSDFYKMCQDIQRQEIAELVAAVKAHGGKFVFPEDLQPCVMVNSKYAGPEDCIITEVSVNEHGYVTITGKSCSYSGFGVYYGELDEIQAGDIALGHIEYIISNIPETDEVSDVTTNK